MKGKEVVKINSKENLIRMMREYQNLVFSICLKMTGDYFIAEDISQDTFVSVYENFHRFNGENERSWVCKIATNKCIDYLKSSKVRREKNLEDEHLTRADKGAGPLELYTTKSVLEEMENKCQLLPRAYREVGQLYFIQGLTAKEISLKMGIHLKTVQTQIYRARDMLRKIVRKEDLL